MKALLIRTDNSVEKIEVDGKLQSLQEAVGGWIECLQLTDNAHAYIDEEGKLKAKEPNFIATMLCRRLEDVIMPNDVIVGDMIVLGTLNAKGEFDGDSHDVPDDFAEVNLPDQDVKS